MAMSRWILFFKLNAYLQVSSAASGPGSGCTNGCTKYDMEQAWAWYGRRRRICGWRAVGTVHVGSVHARLGAMI